MTEQVTKRRISEVIVTDPSGDELTVDRGNIRTIWTSDEHQLRICDDQGNILFIAHPQHWANVVINYEND